MKKFIGWRGCGKTRAICEQAYELAKQHKTVLIIIPSNYEFIIRDYLNSYDDEPNTFLIDVVSIRSKPFKDISDMIFVYPRYDTVLVDEAYWVLQEIFGHKVVAISDTIEEELK